MLFVCLLFAICQQHFLKSVQLDIWYILYCFIILILWTLLLVKYGVCYILKSVYLFSVYCQMKCVCYIFVYLFTCAYMDICSMARASNPYCDNAVHFMGHSSGTLYRPSQAHCMPFIFTLVFSETHWGTFVLCMKQWKVKNVHTCVPVDMN